MDRRHSLSIAFTASSLALLGLVSLQTLPGETPLVAVTIDSCGNGLVEGREVCDDANRTSGDGCSATCAVERGATCVLRYHRSLWTSECRTQKEKKHAAAVAGPCGNGIKERMSGEYCDDGNRQNGDGCKSYCWVEDGFTCTQDEGEKSTCERQCGNGLLQTDRGEECDDGNTNNGDGCNNRCFPEQLYSCTSEEGRRSRCALRCGNGVIEWKTEYCDDGNLQNNDGCDSLCNVEASYTCAATKEGSVCVNVRG